jgi:TolA-binding protein
LVIALAASIAVAVGAVGAVAALRGWTARPSAVAPPEGVPPASSRSLSGVGRASTEPPTPVVEPEPARPARPARPGAKADPFTAELDLLQHAHAAYTRRDFSAALALIADHARRFPNGNLAEQREALRVRSLAGAGRADEAHRAAAAFAARFPRSVLLPRVAEGRESSER